MSTLYPYKYNKATEKTRADRRACFRSLFCHTPITADGLQILLTPVPLADQIIDLLAMILTTILLGFHVLFLPTFVAELIPMIGMLPTWTGCVALVVTLRRKQQAADTTAPQIESKPPR